MFDFFKGKSVIKSQELSQIDNRISRVIEKYINETSRECYSMQVIEGIPTPLDSHMGGMPYMPQNTKWPLDKEENEIPFLIQINFNGMNLEKFPSNGILQIFYNWEKDEQCVRYYEEFSQNFQTEGFLPKWHYDEGWTCGTPLKLELQKNIWLDLLMVVMFLIEFLLKFMENMTTKSIKKQFVKFGRN